MPEPTNPYCHPADSYSIMARRGEVWDLCDSAWRAWLASDEAVERVAEAIGEIEDEAIDGGWNGFRIDRKMLARAVLTALRGEDDA